MINLLANTRVMDIQHVKLDLIHWLTELQDTSILEKIRALKNQESDFNTDKLDAKIQKLMSSRVLKAEEDIKVGRVFSIEEAEKRLGL
jgi:hypothetical protein